jgi:hypothetical protein
MVPLRVEVTSCATRQLASMNVKRHSRMSFFIVGSFIAGEHACEWR